MIKDVNKILKKTLHKKITLIKKNKLIWEKKKKKQLMAKSTPLHIVLPTIHASLP